MTVFLNSSYFCTLCLKSYENRDKHSCASHCTVCCRKDCALNKITPQCGSCNRTCRSADCYDNHLKGPEPKKTGRGSNLHQDESLSPCLTWWKCPLRKRICNRVRDHVHQCTEYKCKMCAMLVLPDHKCFMRALPKRKNPSIIFISTSNVHKKRKLYVMTVTTPQYV